MFGKRTGKHTANLGEFSAEGTTAAEARAALLNQIADYRPTGYVLGTVAGEVFVVTRSLSGTMEYAICGKGRNYGSACLLSTTDAKTAVQAARDHAEQSFDGIAWEHAV